jgi:3'-5' exoribonuclease
LTKVLVSELSSYNVGEKVLLDACVKSFQRKKATNGSSYLDVTLSDKDTEVNGKMWNLNEASYEFISENRFIRALVEIDNFNGKLQVKLSKMGPIPEVELDKSKLEQSAPESIDGLIDELEGFINGITDEAIKTIVVRRYEKNKAKFLIWPAAKSNHHNYPTGLLYHTVSMLRLGRNNIRQYPGKLDGDVVIGSIILHDMDKIHEYSDAYNPDYTELGSLMGHIFMSGAETFHESKLLMKENPDLDFSKVKYLIHAILAHHGKLEWGSPVKPSTIEAEIVHQIDMMDSRMNMKF